MPKQTFTYLFSRLNVLPHASPRDRERFLADGLSGPSVEARGALWGFVDIEKLVVEGDTYLAGALVRYLPEGEEKTVDEQAHATTAALLANEVDAESLFFLSVDTMIVAFHPVPSKIPQRTFRERFAKLFRAAHGDFFVDVELALIQEELAIWRALQEFDKILSFKVRLHPANPRTTDLWEDIQRDLEEKRAEEYLEEYRTSKQSAGLNIRDDREIRGKIAMAEDGYGEASVTGLTEGKTKVASTQRYPQTAEVSKFETKPGRILGVLVEKFSEIMHRGEPSD